MLSNTATFTGSMFLEEESKVLQDYVVGQRLGEGSYGSVYVVKYVPSGENFALKILQKEDLFGPALALDFGNNSSIFASSRTMTPPTAIMSQVDAAQLHTVVASSLLKNNNDTNGLPEGEQTRLALADPLHLRTPFEADHSSSNETMSTPLGKETLDPRIKLIYSLEKKIVQEAKVLQSLEHPHVVKFYKFFNSTVAFYFIMELAEGGELFDLIISRGYFSEEEARHYFQQLISAIDYCHRNGVAHKDLKAENLLLGSDNRLLVCDFGFSSKYSVHNTEDPEETAADDNMDFSDSEGNGMFGTLHYMSPEAVILSTQNKGFEVATNQTNQTNQMRGSSSAEEFGTETRSPTVVPGSDYFNSFSSNHAEHPGCGCMPPPAFTKNGSKISLLAEPECKPSKANVARSPASPLSKQNGCAFPNGVLRPSHDSAWELGEISESSVAANHKPVSPSTAAPAKKEENRVAAFVKALINPEKGMRHARSVTTLSDGSVDSEHNTASTRATKNGRLKKNNNKEKGKDKDKGKDKGKDLPSKITSPLTIKSKGVTMDMYQQDLWSAGVILYFMLTGRLPFDGRDDEETLFLIEKAQVSFGEEEMERISPPARKFVVQMLSKDPADRPTVEQIVRNSWFRTNLNVAKVFPHREDLKSAQAHLSADDFLDFSHKNHHITTEEEQAISTAFNKIDTDGFGTITRDQVRDMLTVLSGDVVPSSDISELVNLFTENPQSAEITFQQFRNAWVKKDLAHLPFTHSSEFQLAKIIGTQMDEVERKIVRQLRTAFDSVDESHSGFIRIDQLRRVFQRCHIDASEEDLVSLVRYFQEQDLFTKRGTRASAGMVLREPNSPCTPSSSPTSTHLGISFDAFVLGIVKREILLFHPLGRKLAAATNLAALFNSRNVTECVRHGFLVVGLQNVIVEKLTSVRERLLLLYSDELVSNTENIYSFRYLGSAALVKGTSMEAAAPLVQTENSTSNFSNGTSAPVARSATVGALEQSIPPRCGDAATDTSNFARSFRHLTCSVNVNSHAGSLSMPAPTIGDLSSNARSSMTLSPRHGSRTQTDTKQMSMSATGRASEGHRDPSNKPDVHSASLGSQEGSADSHDGESNYTSGRDSASILGTDSASLEANSTRETPFTTPTSKQPPHALPRKATAQGSVNGKPPRAADRVSSEAKRPPLSLSPQISPSSPSLGPGAFASSVPVQHLPRLMSENNMVTINTKDLNGSTSVSKQNSKTKNQTASTSIGSAKNSKTRRKFSVPFDTSSTESPRHIPGGAIGLESSDLFTPSRSMNLLAFDQSLNLGASSQHIPPNSHRHTVAAGGGPPIPGGGGGGSSSARGPGGGNTNMAESSATGLAYTSSFTHRALSYGNSGVLGVVSGFCDVDVILSPACLGYTLVRFRRIHGKTSDFHEAVVFISNLLDVERQQAVMDLMPKGESELM